MNSPVREGELLQVLIGGKPGDAVWFRHASAPGWASASRRSTASSCSVRRAWRSGNDPPSGVLDLTIFAPDLPSGWESTIFYCQAVLRDVDTHRFVVSAPRRAGAAGRGRCSPRRTGELASVARSCSTRKTRRGHFP
jgi:hypothetical protein